MTLKYLLESEGRPPLNPPRTLVNVPLFHVTGEVPVMLNSFVIGRGMVLMPKWDAGEALRLVEQEKITYFVGVPTMSLELMNHPDKARFDLSTPVGRAKTYLDYLWNDHAYLRLGFSNAHWISDELVRANQPWPHQLAAWKARGVKTVINLRGGFDAIDAVAELRDGCLQFPPRSAAYAALQ